MTTLQSTLANVTLSALANTEISGSHKGLLAEYSIGLTQVTAANGRHLRQLKRQEGEGFTLKLVVLVLRQFVDSVRVPNKLDGAEILEVADEIVHFYPCESLEDIILALKKARFGGTIFYNKLDQSDIWCILKKHFDSKAKWFEDGHYDQKAQGASQDYRAVAQLGQVAPKLCQQMVLRLDPTHPNAETLRRKLSITNAKEERGLMTPEEAQQSRADVAAANERKPRTDWGPSAEAQQRIDARNRQQDQRYR